MTIRSAAASDDMKKLVVERMLRLIITDIITRELPSVPRNMDTTLAIVNAMTTDKGPPWVDRESLELLVKFFSSALLLNE